MTESERYVEITSLLNKAGTLADDNPNLADLIFVASKAALEWAVVAANREGRDIQFAP